MLTGIRLNICSFLSKGVPITTNLLHDKINERFGNRVTQGRRKNNGVAPNENRIIPEMSKTDKYLAISSR
jgi:hypothetical protein